MTICVLLQIGFIQIEVSLNTGGANSCPLFLVKSVCALGSSIDHLLMLRIRQPTLPGKEHGRAGCIQQPRWYDASFTDARVSRNNGLHLFQWDSYH